MKELEIIIYVVCHKNQMQLDPQTFPDMAGNRQNNLICEIDALLRQSSNLGVGKLELKSVRNITPPQNHLCKAMIYRADSFYFRKARK